MKRLIILMLIITCLSPQAIRASDAQIAVEALKKTVAKGAGISQEEWAAAVRVQQIGAPAIPLLLSMLENGSKDMRELAAFTLRDTDGLKEEHLDALLVEYRNGEGWILPAIASIGTPRAVQWVMGEFFREQSDGTQVVPAVQRLGEKAVPYLLKFYETDDGWREGGESALSTVWKGLGKEAATALEPLMKIANDESATSKKRWHALLAIGSLGPLAEQVIPDLQLLYKSNDPAIREAAMGAIIETATTESAAILVECLDHPSPSYDRESTLYCIARMGPAVAAAGAGVARYLNDPDWHLRALAAGVFGYIEYHDATDALIDLLDCPEDWHVVFSAVGSLGQLKAKRAEPALTKLAREHWFPPVRSAALEAVSAITGGPPMKGKDENLIGPLRFLSFESVGCDAETLQKGDFARLRFPLAETTDESTEIPVHGKGGQLFHEKWPAVKVDEGWLVGVDMGEWGGQIAFKDRHGNVQALAKVNTEDIHRMLQGPVAVTGLAHLSMNEGFLYRIVKNPAGRWAAEKWRTLPGAPYGSVLLQDGRLLINGSGGIVLVSPDGKMECVKRDDILK